MGMHVGTFTHVLEPMKGARVLIVVYDLKVSNVPSGEVRAHCKPQGQVMAELQHSQKRGKEAQDPTLQDSQPAD